MDLESLERRRLLSVSVLQGYPGNYEIYGDSTADVISIAISAADSSFTLNGQRFEAASYISIFSFGGDDSIAVSADGQTTVGVSISAGDGDDNVALGVGGAIWGDGGNDTLRLSDSFRGEVYGGPGDDRIAVSGASANARIDGEDGNDVIDITNSLYGQLVRGGSGDDIVYGSNYDDRIYGDAGNDLLIGFGGNDVFYAVDTQNDRIIGGAGVDVAYADAAESGIWGVEYVFYV